MRKVIRFGIDLTWVALTPFLALFIRDNFVASVARLEGAAPYALLCMIVGAIVITMARLHQTVWRYTDLNDALRVIAGVSVILVFAVSASFVFTRLEGIPRSAPAIQWFLLVAAMVGTRIAFRLRHERQGGKRYWRTGESQKPAEHVLVLGVNDLTELYLRSVNEFARARFAIVGILSRRELRGRVLRLHKILGAPEELLQVIADLELHGVTVERIVVMQPFEQLSRTTCDTLLALERDSAITIDWLVESLGLRGERASSVKTVSATDENPTSPIVEESKHVLPGRYHSIKRAIDATAAIFLALAFAPLMAVVVLLVALDVGLPLVFWQQRPGRYGQPFRLFKFRTMRAGHDASGNRIPDHLRSSKLGRFLRRTWLDELPQLYNIAMGQMSFVGPRPLLPVDQPQGEERDLRLRVRPGLTGWAQVNGGRDISPEDKAALDIWYIMHASPWLDIKILLYTLVAMILGEKTSGEINGAQEGKRMRPTPAVANLPVLARHEREPAVEQRHTKRAAIFQG